MKKKFTKMQYVKHFLVNIFRVHVDAEFGLWCVQVWPFSVTLLTEIYDKTWIVEFEFNYESVVIVHLYH